MEAQASMKTHPHCKKRKTQLYNETHQGSVVSYEPHLENTIRYTICLEFIAVQLIHSLK